MNLEHAVLMVCLYVKVPHKKWNSGYVSSMFIYQVIMHAAAINFFFFYENLCINAMDTQNSQLLI